MGLITALALALSPAGVSPLLLLLFHPAYVLVDGILHLVQVRHSALYNIYIYMYICMYIYTYMYIYMYIHKYE